MDQYCKTWLKFSDLHGKGKIYRTSALCCRVDTPRPKILDKPLNARSKLISIDLLLSLTIITVTKLRQGYVFTGVCDSVHREGVCIPACTGADTSQVDTPGADSPPPGQTPPWADTLLGRHFLPSSCRDTHPPVQCMLGYTLPGGHCSGRYASYWNAFLFILFLLKTFICF